MSRKFKIVYSNFFHKTLKKMKRSQRKQVYLAIEKLAVEGPYYNGLHTHANRSASSKHRGQIFQSYVSGKSRIHWNYIDSDTIELLNFTAY